MMSYLAPGYAGISWAATILGPPTAPAAGPCAGGTVGADASGEPDEREQPHDQAVYRERG